MLSSVFTLVFTPLFTSRVLFPAILFTSRVLFPAILFTTYVVSICYVSCTHLYQESIYLLKGKFVSLTRNAPFPEHAIAKGEDFRGEEQICRREAGPGPLRGTRSPGLP